MRRLAGGDNVHLSVFTISFRCLITVSELTALRQRRVVHHGVFAHSSARQREIHFLLVRSLVVTLARNYLADINFGRVVQTGNVLAFCKLVVGLTLCARGPISPGKFLVFFFKSLIVGVLKQNGAEFPFKPLVCNAGAKRHETGDFIKHRASEHASNLVCGKTTS